MIPSRLYAMSLVCGGLALAACPSYATTPTGKTVGTLPGLDANYTFSYTNAKGNVVSQRKTWQPTNTTPTAERSKALVEASAKKATTKTASAKPGSWTSKYKLYVNCPTEPSDVNFTGPSGLQAAVLHAPEYTTIQVCYGTHFTPGVVVTTSYIKIVGQGDTNGDETFIGAGPGFGILLTGSNDVVENITFQDLEFGVLSGVIIENEDNVVDHNWFNTVGIGTGSIGGDKTLVENNTYTLNVFPIVTVEGVDETICGNTVTGNAAAFTTDGIAVFDSVSATVTSNVVSNTINGLDFGFFNTYATVDSNHFDGNVFGINIYFDNSGNSFEKNQVNGNFFIGILTADKFEGQAAVIDASGPNSFVKNTTLGSGKWDIFDDTAGYFGPSDGNNDETADYYSDNTGDLFSSFPLDIYQL